MLVCLEYNGREDAAALINVNLVKEKIKEIYENIYSIIYTKISEDLLYLFIYLLCVCMNTYISVSVRARAIKFLLVTPK